MVEHAGRCHAGGEGRSDATAPPSPIGGGAMSLPNRQPVSRRGFLAALVATSAAVSAFALSAEGANAASWSDALPVEPPGPDDQSELKDTDLIAHAVHTRGESTMVAQMSPAAQNTAIHPFVV